MKARRDHHEIVTKNYVVACIDVLGQEERLRGFPKLIRDTSSDKADKLTMAIKETYGRVNAVRKLIAGFLKEEDEPPSDHSSHQSFTERQKDEFRKIRYARIAVKHFSDMTVFYAPLRSEKGAMTLIPIQRMLWASAMSMLYSFASGIAVRGGIEIGAALDLPDFEIYGSAYYGAYNLESKIAKYPRIVLGDELMNYVDLWRRSEDDSPQSKLNKTVSSMCLNMVCEDADGRPILDFLSPDISAMFGHSQDEKTGAALLQKRQKGLEFLRKELDRLKSSRDPRDSELAFRYAHLVDYYVARSE